MKAFVAQDVVLGFVEHFIDYLMSGIFWSRGRYLARPRLMLGVKGDRVREN